MFFQSCPTTTPAAPPPASEKTQYIKEVLCIFRQSQKNAIYSEDSCRQFFIGNDVCQRYFGLSLSLSMHDAQFHSFIVRFSGISALRGVEEGAL